MSERDIPAGSQWRTEIGSRLAQARFGIICLTAENQHKPWLLFEAGALAKEMGDFVCPYLIDLEKSDVEEPLAQFQSKTANETETRELVQSINQRLLEVAPDKALSPEDLEKSFSRWWPDLDEILSDLPEGSQAVQRRGVPEMLQEVLELSRSISRQLSSPSMPPPVRVPKREPILANTDGPDAKLQKFRDYIRERRAALAGFMEQGVALQINGNALSLISTNEIYNRYFRDNLPEIQNFASAFFGADIEVNLVQKEGKN